MIEFRKLELEKEGKWLTFDIAVSNVQDSEGNPYFDNVVIEQIQLYTPNNYVENLPTDKGITIYPSTSEDKAVREIHRTIEMPAAADLVFIWVKTSKPSRLDLPCSYKGTTDVGVAFDRTKFFKTGLNLLNGLDGCTPNVNLINSLLQMKAFEIALRTGNFTRAIEWWNKFFGVKKIRKACGSKEDGTPYVPVKTCGCNGR